MKVTEFVINFTVNTVEVLLNTPMLVDAITCVMFNINMYYVRTGI